MAGTVSYADAGGASSVQWSGGAGDVMTIRSDSSFAIDYNSESPWQGVGNDGASYEVITTGAIGGRLATAGGELAEAIVNAASAHISVTRNGTPFRNGSPNSPQVYGYHCSAGTSLTITQGETTESWAPAGS